MIELKDVIVKGKEFMSEVYDNPDEVAESEKSELVNKFRIPLPIKPINSLQNVLGINKRIFYKTVKIDKKGKIIGVIDEDLSKSQVSELSAETV